MCGAAGLIRAQVKETVSVTTLKKKQNNKSDAVRGMEPGSLSLLADVLTAEVDDPAGDAQLLHTLPILSTSPRSTRGRRSLFAA